jgi:hypothetical protein
MFPEVSIELMTKMRKIGQKSFCFDVIISNKPENKSFVLKFCISD